MPFQEIEFIIAHANSVRGSLIDFKSMNLLPGYDYEITH